MKLYEVPVVPCKRRPRAKRSGKNIHLYTPIETLQEENMVALAYKGSKYSCPVRVVIHIFRCLPKKRPKKVLKEADVYKPDIDNIIKSILDGLNGIAYEDDRQVVEIMAIKHDRTRRDHEVVKFGVEAIEGEAGDL